MPHPKRTQQIWKQLAAVTFTIALCCTLPGYCQKQGQERVDSVTKLIAASRNDTQKIRLYGEIGFIYQNINPDSGLLYARKGLALARKLRWEKGMGMCYSYIAVNYASKTNFEDAMMYHDSAMRINKKIGDKRGVAAVHSNMGIIYTISGEYVKAKEAFGQAININSEVGDKAALAMAYGNMSNVYADQSNYSIALEYCFKALRLYEELNETAGIATITLNTGIIYSNLGDSRKALLNLDKALKMVTASQNKSEISKVTVSIGNVYRDLLHDNKKAMANYLFSLKAAEQLGNKDGIAAAVSNIGNIYNEAGDYRNAIRAYMGGYLLYSEFGDDFGQAASLGNAGEVYLLIAKGEKKGIALKDTAIFHSAAFDSITHIADFPKGVKANLELAISLLEKAKKLAVATNYLEAMQEFNLYLSEAYELYGDKDKALAAHKQYAEAKDSIYATTNRIKIAHLETEREVLLKNKQLEINRLEVAKKRNERVFFIAGILALLVVGGIIFRNMRLKSAKELSENKLNAFQARMNPHFIFNALSSIQSLIMNDEKEPSIDYLSEFSTLMRKILDNSTSSKVPLKTEVEMLQSYIQLEHLRFNSFKWRVNIDDKLLNGTVSVPGMIVQPFVENAILHGFMNKKKDGVLTVNFERTEKQIICTVDDNGIGRARSAELNAERNKHRQSHGINIAANRLALLSDKRKGLVNKVTYIDKMENGVAAGTKVIIELPAL